MCKPSTTRMELASRSGDGIDVTLVWVHAGGADETLVCVRDRREGIFFEISAEPYLALDVYHHPFAYRDFARRSADDLRLVA
jgi:hypothetical protein